MEKYLLLFCVFLVTWQIQSAAGFSDHFKNYQIIGDIADAVLSTPRPLLKCKNLNSDDPVDHIMMDCQGLVKSEKGMILTIKNLDLNANPLFYNFTGHSKYILGMGLEITENKHIRKIDMPNLLKFSKSKGLYITSNENLKYIDIRVSTQMSEFFNLTVANNQQLISFLLRATKHEIGNVIFEKNDDLAVILLTASQIGAEYSEFKVVENPKLESLYLQSLVAIGDLNKIDILNNHKLKRIDVPVLGEIASSEVNIIGNDNLVELSFPMLADLQAKVERRVKVEFEKIDAMQKFEQILSAKLASEYSFPCQFYAQHCKSFLSEITILKNARLESINMAHLKEHGGSSTTLVIKQNPKLKRIDIDMEVLKTMHLNIRGNPNLDKEWLKELRNVSEGTNLSITIQMDRECILDEEIKDFSELDECDNISGDLKLANGVTGEWKNISTITGDVYFGDYPWWEVEIHRLNLSGKAYTLRCDGPNDTRVIIEGNCGTEPPTTMENTTTTAAITQQPVTFAPEDFVFEGFVEEEERTTPQFYWLSETDKTTIFLFIILGVFFACLIYFCPYHGDEDDEKWDQTSTMAELARLDKEFLMEIEALDMLWEPMSTTAKSLAEKSLSDNSTTNVSTKPPASVSTSQSNMN